MELPGTKPILRLLKAVNFTKKLEDAPAIWSVTNSSLPQRRGLIVLYLGPIVRVAPFELHIDDPEFYDRIFNFGSQFDKREYQFGQ